MLGGFVSGLIIAWILNCFNVGYMILGAVQPFVSIILTIEMYYVATGLIGLVGGSLKRN